MWNHSTDTEVLLFIGEANRRILENDAIIATNITQGKSNDTYTAENQLLIRVRNILQLPTADFYWTQEQTYAYINFLRANKGLRGAISLPSTPVYIASELLVAVNIDTNTLLAQIAALTTQINNLTTRLNAITSTTTTPFDATVLQSYALLTDPRFHTHTNQNVLDQLTQAMINDIALIQLHITNQVIHITAAERVFWNDKVERTDPRLTDARTPVNHTHTIAEINNLQNELDTINNTLQILLNATAGQLTLPPMVTEAFVATIDPSRDISYFPVTPTGAIAVGRLTTVTPVNGARALLKINNPTGQTITFSNDFKFLDSNTQAGGQTITAAGYYYFTMIYDTTINGFIVADRSEGGTMTGAAIKTLYEAEADTNAFTDAEKAKVASLSPNFKGYFTTLAALQTTNPTGAAGDYAILDKGLAADTIALWDNTALVWIDTNANTNQVAYWGSLQESSTNTRTILQALNDRALNTDVQWTAYHIQSTDPLGNPLTPKRVVALIELLGDYTPTFNNPVTGMEFIISFVNTSAVNRSVVFPGGQFALTGSLTNTNTLITGQTLQVHGVYNGAINRFVVIKSDEGSSGAGTWGSITGTLASQTDLTTALNARILATARAANDGVAPLNAAGIVPAIHLPPMGVINAAAYTVANDLKIDTTTTSLQTLADDLYGSNNLSSRLHFAGVATSTQSPENILTDGTRNTRIKQGEKYMYTYDGEFTYIVGALIPTLTHSTINGNVTTPGASVTLGKPNVKTTYVLSVTLNTTNDIVQYTILKIAEYGANGEDITDLFQSPIYPLDLNSTKIAHIIDEFNSSKNITFTELVQDGVIYLTLRNVSGAANTVNLPGSIVGFTGQVVTINNLDTWVLMGYCSNGTNAGILWSIIERPISVTVTGTSTNLSTTTTTTTVTVLSDTGNDATIPSANLIAAGVMSAADKIQLTQLSPSSVAEVNLIGATNILFNASHFQGRHFRITGDASFTSVTTTFRGVVFLIRVQNNTAASHNLFIAAALRDYSIPATGIIPIGPGEIHTFIFSNNAVSDLVSYLGKAGTVTPTKTYWDALARTSTDTQTISAFVAAQILGKLNTSSFTPVAVRDLLATLTLTARLDASAIQNLPAGTTVNNTLTSTSITEAASANVAKTLQDTKLAIASFTPVAVRDLLATLTLTARLDASAIQNLPAATVLNNTLTSTSITEGATANVAKVLNDKITDATNTAYTVITPVTGKINLTLTTATRYSYTPTQNGVALALDIPNAASNIGKVFYLVVNQPATTPNTIVFTAGQFAHPFGQAPALTPAVLATDLLTFIVLPNGRIASALTPDFINN